MTFYPGGERSAGCSDGSTERDHIEIVISDFKMPGMDGLET